MKKSINCSHALLLGLVAIGLSSCGIGLPSYTRQNQTNEISINNALQIEALKREDYNVLRTTSGNESSSRFYILFFPIGKYKTDKELYENAYYDAVDNLPNADALLLPRQKIRRFIIPLILFNYTHRTVTVSGIGLSVKDKIMENEESDVPFAVARDYRVKDTFTDRKLKNPKITSQQGFEKIFEKSPVTDENNISTPIDFSNQYVIALVGKPTKNNLSYYVNNLKLKRDVLTLHHGKDAGEKLSYKIRPTLILIVDKKYQGKINLKERD